MLIFPALLLLSLSSGALTIKLEEEMLPKLIEERNGRMEQARSSIEAGLSRQGHLFRSFLPRLNANLGQQATEGGPRAPQTHSYAYGSIEANVNLFNGGRDNLTDEVRSQQVERARANLINTKFNLLTAARTLFWQMVYQKEIISILEEAIKLNDKNLEQALKKVRSNLSTKTDEIDFNQSKLQYEQDLEKAKVTIEGMMLELSALLGQEADTVYEVPKLIVHEAGHKLDEFSIKKFDWERHREFLMLEAAENKAKLESELSSRWWFPKLEAYAGKFERFERIHNEIELDQEEGSLFGLRLTFSFDGLESRVTSVAEAYERQGLNALKRQRSLELAAAYQRSYKLYTLNHNLVHSAEENNRLAQKYYENVMNEYMRGIKNSPDLLQAFQRSVEARLRYADIKKDYQIARAQIQDLIQE